MFLWGTVCTASFQRQSDWNLNSLLIACRKVRFVGFLSTPLCCASIGLVHWWILR